MKKNMFLRVASVLLVLTLLSTCAISGTFAKYVTKAETKDTARVAKWGVTITAMGNDAFATEYAADDGDIENSAITNTVVSTENVVAPGTDGALADVAFNGQPEVAVKVSYVADLALSGWLLKDNKTLYLPITITVNDTAYTLNANEDLATFESRVETAIADLGVEYAAGTDLSTVSLDIDWAWAFHVDGDTDIKDTELGDLAAAGTKSEIGLTLTTTVTQID